MVKAYAKINLELKVLNKLENNYHNLEMLNCKISLYDSIYIRKAKKNKIRYSNFKIESSQDTLFKMILSLQKRYPHLPKFNIYIKKRIPIGFGLGGMSSDGASIVNYLNDKYKLNMDDQTKIDFVKNYSTDMCYCLFDYPAIVKGIGDIIIRTEKVDIDKVIVVDPNIYISTKEVFDEVENFDLSNHKYRNDLELIVRSKNSKMDKFLTELSNLNIGDVQMSGSGSAIIITNFKKETIKKIKKNYKNFKVHIYNIRKG